MSEAKGEDSNGHGVIVIYDISSCGSDAEDSSDDAEIAANRSKRQRMMPLSLSPALSSSSSSSSSLSSSDAEDEIAFCCKVCMCPHDEQSSHLISSGDDAVFHRCCCHKIDSYKPDWKSPFDVVCLQMEENLLNNQPEHSIEKGEEYYGKEDSKKLIRSDATKESSYENELSMYAYDQVIYTCAKFLKYNRKYQAVTREEHRKSKRAVVLDVFAGIGAGVVALKRLGIDIKKVIHIEIDPVCTHVFKQNHDCKYNNDLVNDDISYVYDAYSRFEDVESDIEGLLEKYGSIDIVMGGPPCQDYTPVNAFRKGVEGEQGKYLPNFGKFIQVLQEQQGHENPLFFLVENVEIRKMEDMNPIQEVFGIPGFPTDAKDLSPCRRKRHFWINFPVERVNPDDSISTKSCLEEGWGLPADILEFDSRDEEGNWRKANTFMASKARIDDERMLRLQKIEEESSTGKRKVRYKKGTFTVSEREKMLGFPNGYVMHAMELLHKELRKVLLVRSKHEMKTNEYKKFSAKLKMFSGKRFKFKLRGDDVDILIDQPQQSKKQISHFNKEDYSKHLLGNTFSIPVVEHLLKPLSEVFASREYDRYDYKYEWQN
mmetsp:Transcript_22249/g.34247  ORF Transcript_22249/g.34247 Transcript_22249/m.34247 type:complete len:599 (-) Transcript_22249:360-2156(-)